MGEGGGAAGADHSLINYVHSLSRPPDVGEVEVGEGGSAAGADHSRINYLRSISRPPDVGEVEEDEGVGGVQLVPGPDAQRLRAGQLREGPLQVPPLQKS